MQSYTRNSGAALSTELLSGNAVARLLWARRGTRDGWKLADLSARLRVVEATCLRRLAVLDGTLAGGGRSWSIERWKEVDAFTGQRFSCVTLVGPGCSRPQLRTIPTYLEGGPDIISLDDLAQLEESEA